MPRRQFYRAVRFGESKYPADRKSGEDRHEDANNPVLLVDRAHAVAGPYGGRATPLRGWPTLLAVIHSPSRQLSRSMRSENS